MVALVYRLGSETQSFALRQPAVDYLHDAAGQSIGGIWNGGGNQWVFMGERILADYESDGVHFLHPNALNSSTQTTDWTGGNAQTILYYPWGQDWTASPGWSAHATWAGIPDGDPDPSLGQALYRRYSGDKGRWMSPDPIGTKAVKLDDPQTWNMYAYVRNNPTTNTDPTGLIDCSGKNAQLIGCQYLINWNKEHGIKPRSDAPGVPVKLPNGKTVPDKYNRTTRVLMSPTADLRDVAAAGRETKQEVAITTAVMGPVAARVARDVALGRYVATGGQFDYQRLGPQTDVLTGGFQQFPNFRDVSNFNVGLFAQQAGMTLEDTLATAGDWAKYFSSNYNPDRPNGLEIETSDLIKLGYKAGENGEFGPH